MSIEKKQMGLIDLLRLPKKWDLFKLIIVGLPWMIKTVLSGKDIQFYIEYTEGGEENDES